MTSAADLDRAVVVFLGFGVAAFPQRDRAGLERAFGAAAAQELAARVEALLAEVGRFEVDWSAHSLASACERLVSSLRARHPELSEAALRALAWQFSYSWK